ncbi:MAG: DUF1460 domain-containing protein, partial [Odoribacter sp.]|nr:DUF1460 domain-containing protein [Odoribacter sp.]
MLLLNFLNIYTADAQSITSDDNLIFSKFSRFAKEQNLGNLSVSERIPIIGSYFLGTPYVAGTLDEELNEELVINLRGFDCVTFVEVTLALAFVKDYNYGFINDFVNNLVKIRYRGGDISYLSRLHYSTDWLYEMEQTGLLTDVSSKIGGQSLNSNVYYMSKNSSKYPQLKDNKRHIEKIKEIEKTINERSHYFIPEKDISSKTDFIQPGDIILITTNIDGLD